jgi:hypothetical protein
MALHNNFSTPPYIRSLLPIFTRLLPLPFQNPVSEPKHSLIMPSKEPVLPPRPSPSRCPHALLPHSLPRCPCVLPCVHDSLILPTLDDDTQKCDQTARNVRVQPRQLPDADTTAPLPPSQPPLLLTPNTFSHSFSSSQRPSEPQLPSQTIHIAHHAAHSPSGAEVCHPFYPRTMCGSLPRRFWGCPT